MSMTAELVWGVTGGILSSLGILYNVKILKFFWKNEDISLRMFFLRKESAQSFLVLSAASFIYAITELVSRSGLIFTGRIIDEIAKIGSVILLAALVYTFHNIARIVDIEKLKEESDD